MYIAITRKKYKDTYHEQILIRENYREDGKVKTRTIANLTSQPKKRFNEKYGGPNHNYLL